VARWCLFTSFIILCAVGQGLADPAEPAMIQPGFITSIENHSSEESELEKSFVNQQPRLEYFLQEITNFVDADTSNYFYDYINPEVPEQAFIASRFNIYKKMLLLKDIEKSPRERAARHDISKFMATNFKTQRIPSYAYINNPQLPEPLYRHQLVQAAFKSIKDGNIDALHALVNNYDLLDSKDKAGNELLATALIFKKNNMVKFLVSKGSNINAANKFGITPCMIAARTGNLEAADFLARQNCDLKKLDNQGLSALDYAKESKNVSLYFLLKNKLAVKRKR
jgi:hypothetical protein